MSRTRSASTLLSSITSSPATAPRLQHGVHHACTESRQPVPVLHQDRAHLGVGQQPAQLGSPVVETAGHLGYHSVQLDPILPGIRPQTGLGLRLQLGLSSGSITYQRRPILSTCRCAGSLPSLSIRQVDCGSRPYWRPQSVSLIRLPITIVINNVMLYRLPRPGTASDSSSCLPRLGPRSPLGPPTWLSSSSPCDERRSSR